MVRFESVYARYPRQGVLSGGPEVLRDVSFELGRGTFCWLLGETGAGKTSVLRLIGLSLRPVSGTVTVLGAATSGMTRRTMPRYRRQIGVISQDFGLLPDLSVFDNVALPLRLEGRPEAQVRADVTEILGWMGLAGKLVVAPVELSASEQGRAMVARAVVNRPGLLLVDEPGGWLDPEQMDRTIGLLRELSRLGSIAVVATRDRALARAYPAPALHLSLGHLTAAA